MRKIIHKLDQYSGMVDVMPEFIVMHSTPVRVELRLHRATENEDEEDADEHSYISEGTLPAY